MSLDVLTLSPLSLKSLSVAQDFFITVGILCEFAMLPNARCVYFTVPALKRGTLFLRGQMYTFWHHIHQKDKTFCLTFYFISR